jgi:hypothetical protein
MLLLVESVTRMGEVVAALAWVWVQVPAIAGRKIK